MTTSSPTARQEASSSAVSGRVVETRSAVPPHSAATPASSPVKLVVTWSLEAPRRYAATVAGVETINSANDFGKSESFDTLNGTVSVGGKSLDLSTVKYASGSTAAQRLTAVNSALTAAGVAATATSSATGLVLTGAVPAGGAGATAAQISAAAVNFTQATGATSAITAIDTAIATVSTERANLGATQNQFDHTINNANVALQNVTASESRIRDTDMAATMVDFTKSQILSQAGTAMLAQANQTGQGVLSLLR